METRQTVYFNQLWLALEINEKVALSGVSKAEIEDAEIRKEVNHTMLIAKLAISKYKCGKCKNWGHNELWAIVVIGYVYMD